MRGRAAAGYRYLPEPDLPHLVLDEVAIEGLPTCRSCPGEEGSVVRDYALPGRYLNQSRDLAGWFEATVTAGRAPSGGQLAAGGSGAAVEGDRS